jgi:hypothetical protein
MKVLSTFGAKQLSIVEINNEQFVKSYETLVAKINYDKRELQVINWSAKCVSNGFNNNAGQTITMSATTSKHINLIAKEYRLTIIK